MGRRVYDIDDPRHWVNWNDAAAPAGAESADVRGGVATTIELPMLDIRAAVGSISEADRTVELTFSTGADVTRYDYSRGGRYIERLSLDPKHVRLDRLNNGAPLLNAHNSWNLSDVIGAVVQGTARIAGPRDARARVKFSSRPDVEPIWRDVADGIIQNVSVGYVIHKFEEEQRSEGLPIRTAVDWEPYEISMVPIPADPAARVRGTNQMHRCLIVPAGSARSISMTGAGDIYAARRRHLMKLA